MTINEEQVAPPMPEADKPEIQAEAGSVDATTSEPAAETPVAADETPAVAAAPVVESTDSDRSAVQVADDLDLFDQWMSSGTEAKAESSDVKRRLSKGDRIEATVIAIARDRVFVDLGTKSEGEVPLEELTDEKVETAEGLVNIGDKIQVIVLRTDGGNGNPIVSKRKADFDEAWLRIIRAHEDGTMLTAQVVDRVKGGLVVDIGVRGFVPATHVGNGKLRNLDKYVGQPLELKVIEIDRERKKVVLSNREAEEKRRDELKERIFTDVNPGDVLDGTVRRLTDYGAFVDLGGIDGLLHISEMSWMRVNHPKEVLKEGQKLKVMVLKLDKGVGKISLGLRQVLPDPWNEIKDLYKIGQKLTVTIGRMVQSGAFVRLPEGAEAFLPISEISHRRIAKPQDILTEGQEIEVTVIDLRPDERRMVLSLKHGTMPETQIGYGYGSAPANDFEDRRGAGNKDKRKGKKGGKGSDYESGSRGSSSGGATIGERLGMLKGFHFRSDEDSEEAKTEE